MIDCAIDLHLVAAHLETPQHYEWKTPGVGIFCRPHAAKSLSIGAGSFSNSLAARSQYVAVGWQPLNIGPVAIGAFVGGINGYPVNSGNWFPFAGGLATLPWKASSQSGEWVLKVIPPIKEITPLTLGLSVTFNF